jgi:two-component system, LuxR family, response regulator FixJ
MFFEDSNASQFTLFGASEVGADAEEAGDSRAPRNSLLLCGDTDAPRAGGAAADGPLIAVIDDDERVRQSTVWLLEGAGYRVLPYASGDTFLTAPMSERVHVVLLDMNMPGRNGLDVLRALAARDDAPTVLVLTGHGDVNMAVEAMKLKAADFLQKPYPPVALLEALESVLAAREQERADQTPGSRARALVDSLAPRQRQVLAGIVRGQANKTIAWELGLSVRTIEDYRAQLIERLGVRCTAEAIRIGLDAGIKTSGAAIDAAA